MILSTALLCLAATIYHEGRGEPIAGQQAIAQVVMNRTDRDPRQVCRVVAESKQFSWTNASFGLAKTGRTRIYLTRKGEPKDERRWATAKSVAFYTIWNMIPDFTHGAVNYHTVSTRPVWRKELEYIATYGSHRFYRVKEVL